MTKLPLLATRCAPTRSPGIARPNAKTAQLNHIHFLGQDTLPIELVMMVGGIALAIRSVWLQLRRESGVSGQATREQPTAA